MSAVYVGQTVRQPVPIERGARVYGGPYQATPRPRGGTGPINEILMSGDRYLNTTSQHNGGLPGSGLGTLVSYTQNAMHDRSWGENALDSWPALGGTTFEFSLNDSWADQSWDEATEQSRNLPWTHCLLGWFVIDQMTSSGLAFMAHAILTPTGPQVEVAQHSTPSDLASDLWWDGPQSNSVADEPYVAQFKARFQPTATGTSPDVTQDRIAVFPVADRDLPSGVVVWSAGGALYAAKFWVERDPALYNTVDGLKTVIGATVPLGQTLAHTTGNLELHGHAVSDERTLLAWIAADGIRTARLDATGTPALADVTLALAGTYGSVDIAWMTGELWSVVGGSTTGGAVAVVATSGGVVASTTIAVAQSGVRGGAVAGRPFVLSRSASRWRLWVYTPDLAGFTEFDAGPQASATGLQGNFRPSFVTTNHVAVAMGHPDGRIITHIRQRYGEKYDSPFESDPVSSAYPGVWIWAPTQLFTYDPAADTLTSRDAVFQPWPDVVPLTVVNGNVSTWQESPDPMRFVPHNDFFAGFEQSGHYQPLQDASADYSWLGILHWSSMPPNLWFKHILPLSRNRAALTWSPTNYEGWFTIDNPTVGGTEVATNQGYRQAVAVVEWNDSGAVIRVGAPVMLSQLASYFEIQACATADGTRLHCLYAPISEYWEPVPRTQPDPLKVASFAIDENCDLTLIADVELIADHGVSGGPLALVDMGGDILAAVVGNDLLGIRLDETGTAVEYTATSLLEQDLEGIETVFNYISLQSAARVADSDVLALAAHHSATYDHPRINWHQLALAAYRLNRDTLSLEFIDKTVPWDADNPSVVSDFLGWHQDAGGLHAQFDAAGQNIWFPLQADFAFGEPFPQVMEPFGSVAVGSQPWAITELEESIVAWATIEASGSIRVDYRVLDWNGKGTTQPNATTPSRRAWFFREGTYSLADLARAAALDGTTGAYVGYTHTDFRAYADHYIDAGLGQYLIMFSRTGEGVAVSSVTHLHQSDGDWHFGIHPVPGTTRHLMFYDGEPGPTARCDPENLDSDAYHARFRLIGAGRSRATASAGAQVVRTRRIDDTYERGLT